MEQNSYSSEKKTDETNISTLTDQIVFKSSVFNQSNNNTNSNHHTNSKCNNITKHNKTSSSFLKDDDDVINHTHNDANLSFRTQDGKNNHEIDEIEKLCSRVSEVLKLHECERKPKKEQETVDYKKIFFKKNEKELEVFESEREVKDEPNIHLSSESENSEDYDMINSYHKSKSLSKVICTLSKIENGSATFVSKDDLIFVLPSFFIPKNLNIGNTYMFKLNELDQANNKLNKVNTIHKYYSQDQNE